MTRVLSVRRVGGFLAGVMALASAVIAYEFYWFVEHDPMDGVLPLDRSNDFAVNLPTSKVIEVSADADAGIADLFGKPSLPKQKTGSEPTTKLVPRADTISSLVLRGVIVAQAVEVALVQQSGSAELKRLQIGDLIDGWRLSAVNDNNIELTSGDETHVLWLPDENMGDGRLDETD